MQTRVPSQPDVLQTKMGHPLSAKIAKEQGKFLLQNEREMAVSYYRGSLLLFF
jgi:hypothetical protein